MRSYDLVVIIKSSLKEDARKKLHENLKKELSGMKIVKEDDWGQKPLAYAIKREYSGIYYVVKFETEESVPTGLDKWLLTNENILRHLLIRTK